MIPIKKAILLHEKYFVKTVPFTSSYYDRTGFHKGQVYTITDAWVFCRIISLMITSCKNHSQMSLCETEKNHKIVMVQRYHQYITEKPNSVTYWWHEDANAFMLFSYIIVL